MKIKIFNVIKDISNYMFLRKTIKKLEKTDEWKKLNLRHDWIYRIYTVINLEPEYFQNENLERTMFIEQYQKISNFLMNHNLGEIIKPVSNKIEGEYAYFLYYKPLFLELDWAYFFSRMFFISIILFILYNVNFVKMYNSISNFYEHIIKYIK